MIAGAFEGRRGQYRQFLSVEGATPAVARDVIRDQLLQAKVARGLRVAPISGADVTAFIKAHAGTRTRSVETVRPVRWLVGQTRGVAIPGLAPPSVLSAATGSTVLVHAEDGPVRVRVLGAKVALPKAERSKARLAVRALILAEARRVALARLARRCRAGRGRHRPLPCRRRAADGSQQAAAALAAAPAAAVAAATR